MTNEGWIETNFEIDIFNTGVKIWIMFPVNSWLEKEKQTSLKSLI